MTFFVALGVSPDAGLDGVLSICITPQTDQWSEVSLMHAIEEKYEWNTIYVSYKFVKVESLVNLYVGIVEFATTADYVDEMTFGG